MSASGVPSVSKFDELWSAARVRHGLSAAPPVGDSASFATLEDVYHFLERDEKALKAFRKKGETIRAFLKPFAHFVGLFIDSGAEGAAAAGVLGGKAVFSAVAGLLAATKGVSQAYDALEELLSKLQSFLARLETYLADPAVIKPALESILVKILAQLLEVLALCTNRFDKEVHRFSIRRLKRAEDYVKVLIGNTEVQDALKKLDKLVDEEQLRLAVETFVAARSAAIDVAELRKELRASDADGITSWLSPPDPDVNHHTASKSRQSETGEWFFDQRFDAWKNTPNGVYWVHGKPGSGKSVLFSSIVDKLQSEGALVLYFYFDFRDSAKQTLRGLLLSLIYQLASRSQDCLNMLKRFHEEHRASLSPPNDSKLIICLKDMLRASCQIYVLLDALDECSKDTRHDELIPFLEEIIALRFGELHILVTSRPEDDLRVYISPMVTKQLSLHTVNEQANALARHVTARLANLKDYGGWSEELRARAKEVLVANAGGMFLWVNLQLQRLRRCDPTSVNGALATLLKTLHDTYERILLDIEEDNADLARHIFECIAFAASPLTPDELAEVFYYRWNTNEDAVFAESHFTDNVESRLLRVCSSFIQILDCNFENNRSQVITVNPFSGFEVERVVQFVHFSAQEYLLSTQLPSRVSRYGFTSLSAHTTLARLCLASLNSSLSIRPFTSYARRNWMIHVQLDSIQKSLEEPLSRFFDPLSFAFSHWLEAWMSTVDYTWRPRERTGPYFCDKNSTPLYITAHLGLHHYTQILLDSPGVVINAPHAPILYACAYAGHVAIVRLLLEHGADIHACTKRNETPLHAAARFGNIELARLFFNRGAALNARQYDQRMPLHLAAWNGDVDFARELLDMGATINACRAGEDTPLHIAAGYGHTDIAHLLIERGSAIDPRDAYQQTPLHRTAKRGHVEVVRLLFERGAAVDARDSQQQTPLHLAALHGHDHAARLLLELDTAVDACQMDRMLFVSAVHGHVDVARFLLERGANANARVNAQRTPLSMQEDPGVNRPSLVDWAIGAFGVSSPDCTPLHVATLMGHTNMVRLLLNFMAAIDALDDEGRTPLDCALQKKRFDVVYLFLERGATIDSRKINELLVRAAEHENINLVRWLLERGANVNTRLTDDWLDTFAERTKHESTPLHMAASHGNVDISLLLLDCAAAVEARDREGLTPVHYAASYGHVDVARLLLEHGAAVEARDGEGLTPLHCAAFRGHVNVAHLLFEHGAAFDARGKDGREILHLAAQGGQIEFSRLLLERGAAIDARSGDKRTPLHSAAEYSSRPRIIRFLIDQGATLEARGEDGQTPLHLAAQNESFRIARELLNHGAAIDARDNTKRTPLHFAVVAPHRHADVTRLLLERGAAVDIREGNGQTPLHLFAKTCLSLPFGAEKGRVDFARELLKHGADINARDNTNCTPLLLAARHSYNRHVIHLLVDKGAAVNVHEEHGRTPLQLAVQAGFDEAVSCLLDCEAAINARTDAG